MPSPRQTESPGVHTASRQVPSPQYSPSAQRSLSRPWTGTAAQLDADQVETGTVERILAGSPHLALVTHAHLALAAVDVVRTVDAHVTEPSANLADIGTVVVPLADGGPVGHIGLGAGTALPRVPAFGGGCP